MTEKELLAARQSIVQKLTQARLEKGLSQEQLAKRIGTQRSNICRIEKGTQNLSLDLMLKIAEALDKDVSVMLEERSSTMEKEYSLRLYDETLLTFTLEERGLEGLQATILHTETTKQKLFPLDLELTNEGVVKWLERRVIPKNRQFVDKDKDHCPCLKACRYHGNCKECVAIHRAHQEHVPNCMRPLINKKLKLMSELTEHTLANEIEAPHEILRK